MLSVKRPSAARGRAGTRLPPNPIRAALAHHHAKEGLAERSITRRQITSSLRLGDTRRVIISHKLEEGGGTLWQRVVCSQELPLLRAAATACDGGQQSRAMMPSLLVPSGLASSTTGRALIGASAASSASSSAMPRPATTCSQASRGEVFRRSASLGMI